VVTSSACRRSRAWRAAAGEIDFDMELDRRLQPRKQDCAKLAYDAVNLMMRTNGSAGMRGGAMWQRYQRDLTVLMTHNTVQPELAADSYGRLHFGLLPHGVDPGDGAAPAAGALSAREVRR
jgi:Acyl-CoA dehydrogenase, C-terminal domain